MVQIITKVLKCGLRMCRREGVVDNPMLILMVEYYGLNAQEGVVGNPVCWLWCWGANWGVEVLVTMLGCRLECKNGWNIQNLWVFVIHLEACGVVNTFSVSRLTFRGSFLMYVLPWSTDIHMTKTGFTMLPRVLHKLPSCLVQWDKLVGLNIFTRSRIVGFDQLELLTSPGTSQTSFLSSPVRLWVSSMAQNAPQTC